jgi:Uma2 family endonuclease
MSTTSQFTTADELLRMSDDGYRYELIEGELRKMTPAGYEHGHIIGELSGRLWQYVRERSLGSVLGAETGFRLSRDPDTVLAPDISFVRQDQIDTIGIPKEFFPEAPDLAVEVVSPSDTAEEVDDKMRRWLAAGVRLAWVVHPGGRTVTVYRSTSDIELLSENDALDGGDVVPGFTCRVGDVLVKL